MKRPNRTLTPVELDKKYRSHVHLTRPLIDGRGQLAGRQCVRCGRLTTVAGSPSEPNVLARPSRNHARRVDAAYRGGGGDW